MAQNVPRRPTQVLCLTMALIINSSFIYIINLSPRIYMVLASHFGVNLLCLCRLALRLEINLSPSTLLSTGMVEVPVMQVLE